MSKAIYISVIWGKVKLIRHGTILIIIIMVLFPSFFVSTPFVTNNQQLWSQRSSELINNNSIHTESCYHYSQSINNLQKIYNKIEVPVIESDLSNGADNVTFNESGLPGGNIWYVNLSGNLSSGAINSSSYTFHLLNNNYSYCIGTPMKIYHANGGVLNASRSTSAVQVSFCPYFYQVNLTEKGLANYTYWSVDFNGSHYYALPSVTINETNGTYNYTVCNLTNYNIEQPNGTIVVNGKSVNRCITFVGFAILKGIVSPPNAILKVNGTIVKLNESGTFCIKLKPGSYNISISCSGYETFNHDGFRLSIATTILTVRLVSDGSTLLYKIVYVSIIFGAVSLVILYVFYLRKKGKY